MKKHLLAALILMFLVSCAHGPITLTEAQNFECVDPAGFWWGLWNGMTASVSWIGALITRGDEDPITVYNMCNNGGWYLVGFVFGIGSLLPISFSRNRS